MPLRYFRRRHHHTESALSRLSLRCKSRTVQIEMSRRWVGNARERKFSYSRTRQWRRDHAPYDCCKGKHVAITGACSGIGLELAREAIHRDAKAVSLIDITDAERVVRELRDEAADGLSAIFLCKVAAYKADVSKYEEVRGNCCRKHARQRRPAATIDVIERAHGLSESCATKIRPSCRLDRLWRIVKRHMGQLT